MDVSLTSEESEAVRNALRSYLSDLRVEISDTDNPQFKRGLREERSALESAVAKLDRVAAADGSEASGDTAPPADAGGWAVVRLYWTL